MNDSSSTQNDVIKMTYNDDDRNGSSSLSSSSLSSSISQRNLILMMNQMKLSSDGSDNDIGMKNHKVI